MLITGKKTSLQSQPIDTTINYAFTREPSSELTSENFEREEKFHEEELQSMETLSDDTWIYEEVIGKPLHEGVLRSTISKKESDRGGRGEDTDKLLGESITDSDTLVREVRTERSLPTHDREAEKSFYEEEYSLSKSLANTVYLYDAISLPADRLNADSKELLLTSVKVSESENSGPSSQSDKADRQRKRQRLALKTSRVIPLLQGGAKIGNKIFFSNKDAETGQCFPPRTTHDLHGITDDLTLPVEDENGYIKQDINALVYKPSLITTDSSLIAICTNSKSQPAKKDVSTPDTRYVNVMGSSCTDEASTTLRSKVRLPVPYQEGTELSMKRDLEGSRGGLKASDKGLIASLEHAATEQTADNRALSKAKFRQPNLQQEGSEGKNSQEISAFPYGDEIDYSLTAFFDEDVYSHDSLEEFELGLEPLEEFEDFTPAKDRAFGGDLSDIELLDEELPEEEASQGETERIGQYLRACQRAVEFIKKNDWDYSYLHVLAEVLNTRGYGAILIHLQQHADDGMEPEEFQLAIQLKAFWSQNRMLWIAFHRNGNSDSTYRVLSWAQCLRIIEMLGTSMGGIPQIEEIERFIESLFDEWYENDGLRQYFKSFSKYLSYVVYRADPEIPVHIQLKWESDDLEHEDELGWVTTDPMGEKFRKQLTSFGIVSIMDHPEEAKTWFDLRYRDPSFNPEVQTKSTDNKSKNVKECSEEISEMKTEVSSSSLESLDTEKSEAEGSFFLGAGSAAVLPRSAEEVLSSLQELFLKGYSKDEAAQALGLNQIEISNYLLVRK